MQPGLRVRWGKVLGWALLSVGGLGGLVVALIFFVEWRQARGNETKTATAPEEPVRLKRFNEYTVLVPKETQDSVGLRTSDARAVTGTRTLPPLNGCLALDTNRLVRIHARLPGEVISLGTHETDAPVGISQEIGRASCRERV